jgi:hypothetical protein
MEPDIKFPCNRGGTAEITLIFGATKIWVDIYDGDFGEAYFDAVDLGSLIYALTKLREAVRCAASEELRRSAATREAAAITPAPSEPQP